MGRMAKVPVTVSMMAALLTRNSWAKTSKRKTTTKKTKASSVQPREPASTACQWSEDCARPSDVGLAIVVISRAWSAAERSYQRGGIAGYTGCSKSRLGQCFERAQL